MRPNVKKQTHKTRRLLLIIGSIIMLFAFFVGMNVWKAYQNAATFPRFWEAKANEPIPANAIRIVALGDSATQAIGADQPMMDLLVESRYMSRQRPIALSILQM